MDDDTNIQKIDLEKVDWRGSREFFESLGEALDKLDDKDEAYDFTWVGKRKAIIEAGAPINKTFRPNVGASKNWDTTENLFIEGDNLDALKLLQESYLGKVKMIYIDPPYNTGKDFVYHDDFKANVAEYDEATEYKDESGNIQFKKNEKTNGRYHSDWLSMMLPRLKLARNLLADDGVIFISIDDNEQDNLLKLAKEIFGEDQYVSTLVWEKKKKGTYLSNSITSMKEYVLVFAKQISSFKGLIGSISTETETYPCINGSNKRDIRKIPAGILSKYREKDYYQKAGTKISVETMDLLLHSDLIIKDGILAEELVIEGNWRYNQDAMYDYAKKQEIYITQDLYLRRIVNEPRYKTLKDLLPRVGEEKSENHRVFDVVDLYKDGWGSNEDGEEDLRNLMGAGGFVDYPKPIKLIAKLSASVRNKEMLIMDFFCGSGTTAHAIMKLNALDGGNRKWIMVQLPEETDESSEAYKAGYKTIPEISRERIRRAGDKIASEHPDAKVDYGFRALTVADTNYKDVYRATHATTQQELLSTVDNVKEDRTELDLLYGVLTASALELNRPLVAKDMDGSTVFLYDYLGEVSGLVACFADTVSEETIKEIAGMKPLTAVFKDSTFPDSQAKVNLSEHFRIISPETKVKVI